MTAELFANRRDFAGRDPLDVHLGERGHQSLLAALITLENLSGKPSVAILGHSQFELSYSRNQAAGIVAAAIA